MATATRLILVPEQMYKGLMAASLTPSTTRKLTTDGDHLGLDFVKQNLEKVKRKRIKNLSAKNVTYNQELRRFLRLNKQLVEKPVKVRLSNGW
jgi:hypothetical protein